MKALLLALALLYAPAQKIPGWHETTSQRHARYTSIADDIAHTVSKHGNLPGLGAADSATLMLAVAIGESGLAPDADLGPCYREGAFRSRCDGGNAAGIMQTWVGPKQAEAIFADRRLHLALAHRRLGASLHGCRRLPVAERLAMYGSGNCRSKAGRKGSRSRWSLFTTLRLKRWVLESEATAQAKR